MASNESHDDRTQSFVALTAGTTVSHYTIVEKIGAGGMGEVYLAEDTELKRYVALKFLPPHLCQDDDCRKRFKREAQATAKLDHPNIVPVYEVGEHKGRPFFAMAHIDGRSLREVIKDGKLSVSDAIGFTMRICEGLHRAHESGVVHRDIKPSNIIIDTENRPRIVDFGLATVSGEEKLTKTGSTLGTVGYMSPEQIEGKQVDLRSDIFSVGVILYEMLTGHRPFGGDTDAAVARSITDTAPEPIARYKSGTTGELQQVVDKVLSKDPSLRYQHADDMLADLKRLQAGAGPARKRLVGIWLGAAAILIIAGWFAVNHLFLKENGDGGKWANSIAVLIFRDQSPEGDQGFFCEGMTDAIIGRLSSISNLKVISLTSVLQYSTRDRDLRKIGHQLGVENILEGSIMRSGDRVRVRAQLIDVDEDAHLWSEQYDREVEDIFAVQDEISRTIVSVMRVRLVGEESVTLSGRGTENIEAYNLYLQARHLWRKRIGDDMVKAIEYLEQAIALDPEFVLAYAALADAWNIIPGYHGDYEWNVTVPKAREAALKAIELDDLCAEAHTALGLAYRSEQEYTRAEEQYLRAIELNPGYSWAHLWYSNLLEQMGDRDGKIRELEVTLELDPLSVPALGNLASIRVQDGEANEAERLYRRLLEVAPDNVTNRAVFADFLSKQGRTDESLEQLEKAIEIAPRHWSAYYNYAKHLEEADRSEEAEQVFQDALEDLPDEAELFFIYGSFLLWERRNYRVAAPQLWKAIGLDSTLHRAYNDLAYCYQSAKDADSALWAINKAIELDPDYAELYDTKGDICSKLGMLDTSLVAYRRCLEIRPWQTKSMIGMARVALLLGQYDLADSLYEVDANQEKAGHYRAYGRHRQAQALTYRGRFREAAQMLWESARADSAEIKDPNEMERVVYYRYWNLLDIYKYYIRDFEAGLEIARALRHWGTAESRIEARWKSSSAGNMAYIYARGGDFANAEAWLDTVESEIDTASTRDIHRLHFYKGAVALEKGDYEKAIEHLEISGYVQMKALAYLGIGQNKKAIKMLERSVANRFTHTMSCWQARLVWFHYLLGTAYEADGQTDKAIEQYEIFLDTWKDADEGLESVEDARQRLAVLKP